MAVDIFEPRIMTQMIEAGQNTKHTWLRDRYFANRPTFTAKKIDFDVVAADAKLLRSYPLLMAAKSLTERVIPL